jgi:phosphohistidine phosphatase
MDLLIIRHAIAAEREEFNGPDERRPLTEDGKRKMAQAAAGLGTIAPPIQLLATSPLVRAQQTAEIVKVALTPAPARVETTDVLSPDGTMADFLAWISGVSERGVALVGHEPHLSKLVTWLVCGTEESRIELKKGAACLLELHGERRARAATLLWALAPSHLRKLAK